MLGRIGYGGRVELESMDVHIQSRAAGVRVVGLGQVRAGAGAGQRVVGAARQTMAELLYLARWVSVSRVVRCPVHELGYAGPVP